MAHASSPLLIPKVSQFLHGGTKHLTKNLHTQVRVSERMGETGGETGTRQTGAPGAFGAADYLHDMIGGTRDPAPLNRTIPSTVLPLPSALAIYCFELRLR